MTRVVGRYEVLRELGRGGMATVHLARQGELDRLVALKEMTVVGADRESLAKRFVRESQLAGSLSHPNIVTVFDFFEHDSTPFIAMEYAEGGSLRSYVNALTDGQRIFALTGILAGLVHAEDHGVVHRDLKPENVLVSAAGRVKITDFGVAKATRTYSTALTGVGMTVGTPGYMAPEQAMAQPVGPWTDLYALGCMAYELFAGRVPFADSEGPMAILMRHVSETIPPANTVNPHVDPAISNWIAALTAREPGRRVQSAQVALESLEDIAITLLGPRWEREGRLAAPTTPAPPTVMPSMVFETYQAPAASSSPPAVASSSPPPADPPSPPPTDTDSSDDTVFETYVALPPVRPPTNDDTPPSAAAPPDDAPSPPPADASPPPATPVPREAARVDHAAVAPDAFLPGRSHYRGQPPGEQRTRAPHKPPPQPERDAAAPPPRVPPPLAIAAAVLVVIVLVAVLALVA